MPPSVGTLQHNFLLDPERILVIDAAMELRGGGGFNSIHLARKILKRWSIRAKEK